MAQFIRLSQTRFVNADQIVEVQFNSGNATLGVVVPNPERHGGIARLFLDEPETQALMEWMAQNS